MRTILSIRHKITTQILNIIRYKANEEDMSISSYGRKAGISKAWLSKLMHTDANLSIETASKLLDVADYELKIVPKGE